MKLLITTQVVDRNDPVLGFFVRWVDEFAKHCEVVTVICLREGVHSLPANVHVFELPKGRVARAWQFLRYVVRLRKKYDAVFVHMNPEYVVLAGWFWRLWRKKIVLWYVHKSVDFKLRIAVLFANTIATASKESFRLRSSKVQVMGHGIDADFFFPDPAIVREQWWLSAGRLNKSKRHDLAIRAAAAAGKELRIVGDGSERANLETLAQELGAQVVFLGGLTHAGIRDAFRRAALFLHTSETGSLDKVVLEALACGCPVRTNDPALKYLETASPEQVRREHSLPHLIAKLIALYRV